MKKVVKFGGSSLASARQFKKVKAIIDADKARGYVVPSAPGKRDGKDTKVTDLLYQCYEACAAGQSYKRILDQIKKRFDDIINGLDLDLNLDLRCIPGRIFKRHHHVPLPGLPLCGRRRRGLF